jgi:hypothetical protein
MLNSSGAEISIPIHQELPLSYSEFSRPIGKICCCGGRFCLNVQLYVHASQDSTRSTHPVLKIDEGGAWALVAQPSRANKRFPHGGLFAFYYNGQLPGNLEAAINTASSLSAGGKTGTRWQLDRSSLGFKIAINKRAEWTLDVLVRFSSSHHCAVSFPINSAKQTRWANEAKRPKVRLPSL